MLRLLVWICCAATLVVPPLVHQAAAGGRGVIAITARVVDACSVSAPDLVADGSAGAEATVDHRCTASTATVPYTVSVRSIDDATDGDGATVTAHEAADASGEALVVTVTY